MSVSGQERFVNFYTDFAFKRLFEQAEIAKYTPAEVGEYERSLKEYRDIINVLNTAERKGREKGRAEGRAEGELKKQLEIARNAKAMGMEISMICQLTGLTAEEIESL